MKPVKTASSNFVYQGPTPDIGDLDCRVDGEVTTSVWRPSEDELRFLIDGGLVELKIWRHPIPPVALSVTGEQPVPE